MKKKGLLALLLVVILVLAVGGFGFLKMTGAKDSSNKKAQTFVVEQGSGTSQIASQLEAQGLIRSANGFKIYARLRHLDGKFQAGTYNLNPSMDVTEISAIIAGGKVATISVTIPEGLNEYEVADLLAKNGLVDKDNFINVIENTDFTKEFPFLEGAQTGAHRLEGYLFPDTYSVPEGSTEEDIVRMMLKAYQKVFTDDMREQAKKMGYSENEILTIASIIEKESGIKEDHAKVSSVIYNRLEIGMPLQMDSTVTYSLKINGKKAGESTTYADLEEESPYNTYKYGGLPPGPICGPSKNSIQAALNPAKTNYLYFVVSQKLDGSSYFTDNYQDFLKEAEAYGQASRAESQE